MAYNVDIREAQEAVRNEILKLNPCAIHNVESYNKINRKVSETLTNLINECARKDVVY